MTKTYSKKSNARRAAVADLGREAVEGVDYCLIQKGRDWTWSAMPRNPTGGSRQGTSEPRAAPGETRIHSTRIGSKQAKVITMLRRPQGASLDEITRKTGWQRHTVRGAISGALKKKLGLTITSERVEGRGRVYLIAD